MRARILAVGFLLLAGCTPPTVPDVTYFRLPPAPAVDTESAPLFGDLPLVVEVFTADGLYAEQALIYALDPAAETLRSYHYQLWIDPPARLLQRRLIEQLRSARAAPLVTDRLPSNIPAVHISGVIRRFDRVKQADGYRIFVALEIRAERSNNAPMLQKTYRSEFDASGGTLGETVNAFGSAVDRAFAEFQNDLRSVAKSHAR
jgi:cholesterol transport system auxiliary component